MSFQKILINSRKCSALTFPLSTKPLVSLQLCGMETSDTKTSTEYATEVLHPRVEAKNDGGAMELWYVLRNGAILGPFPLDALRELVKMGDIAGDVFVQRSTDTTWKPLAWALNPDAEQPDDGALAPDWETLLAWSWLRLRYNLGEQSLTAAWICIGLGSASVFLSQWRAVFWLPWFVAAAVASYSLLRRGKQTAGVGMTTLSFALPVLLWYYFLGAPSR